ncbi:MAG TPA: hypothetical protein VFM98_15215, partial [Ramlibacter sp.]|uniref:ABC transporter ATP-binding protein C-terminal domain-containing protein n=1 Tax=Ramlibacter sp. TaxID=1917967 RepID=UPI002D7F2D9D
RSPSVIEVSMLHRPRRSLFFFLGALAALLGCETPNTDPGPGSVPEVAGEIDGTVLYVGPRPICTYVGGTPAEIRGNPAVIDAYLGSEHADV